MSHKRSIEELEIDVEIKVEEVVSRIKLPPGWIDLVTNDPDVTLLLAHMAEQAGVTERDLKKTRRMLPSFSQAKWKEVALEFGLPPDLSEHALKLERHSPPMCYLPPAFHKELFQGGWRVMDVYKEKHHQSREAARVKLLETVSSIFSRFRVIIHDS